MIKHKKLKLNQWQGVLLGMILGIVVGLRFGESAMFLQYLGVLFLSLIKMVTMPLIFCTIIYGMTSVESYAGLGRMSRKAIAIFLFTAMIAACIGLVTSFVIQPGETEHKNKIIQMISNAGNMNTSSDAPKSLISFLLNIIPSNVLNAMASDQILQVIVFAFFCGIVLNKNRSQCDTLIKVIHQFAQMLFSMIGSIMKLAPIGVFGYITSIVAVDGISVMMVMAKLILTIVIGCMVQYIVFGVILFLIGRISPMPFYKKIFNIQLIAFSTSSSKATLVPMMETCEKHLGISREGSRFILPLSAALNMDGGAIYQVSCAIFFSQIYGMHFELYEYLIVILMSTIASIGGAGIPSGVLLFLGMVLNSVGIPMNGVLIIATVDRILDMFTTAINVTGDVFATLMVEISEKRLNKREYLSDK